MNGIHDKQDKSTESMRGEHSLAAWGGTDTSSSSSKIGKRRKQKNNCEIFYSNIKVSLKLSWFTLHLTEKLERCGLKQFKLDPCLFFGNKVICIVYVDDLLFWSPKEEFIIEL